MQLHTNRCVLLRLTGVAVDFTQYHTGTAVFVCVSVGLERSPTHAFLHSLSVSPVLIPPSSSGPGLHMVLMVTVFAQELMNERSNALINELVP